MPLLIFVVIANLTNGMGPTKTNTVQESRFPTIENRTGFPNWSIKCQNIKLATKSLPPYIKKDIAMSDVDASLLFKCGPSMDSNMPAPQQA